MNQQQESPPLQQGSVPNRDSRPSESPNKATKGLSPTEVAGAGRSPNPQLMGSVPNRDFHKGSPTNPTLQQGSVPNREADLRNLPTRGLSPSEGGPAQIGRRILTPLNHEVRPHHRSPGSVRNRGGCLIGSVPNRGFVAQIGRQILTPSTTGSVPILGVQGLSPIEEHLQQGSVPNRQADFRNPPTKGLSPN
jgi:hypothetical protein